MGKFFCRRLLASPLPEFLSVKFLLRFAGAISVLFLIAHLAGLRSFTCILNGTVGSLALGWQISQILALGYIFIYLLFVVLVPVLVLAAVILAVWQRSWKR